MNAIIVRPRIVERIAAASLRRLALILAPAGYGKSVALQQYLAILEDSAKCFDDGRAFLAWSAQCLASFTGTIALDGLERCDAQTLREIVASIEDANHAVRWVIVSRSASELPVGTWLAYRECDLPIGAPELAFTRDELSAAARESGLTADSVDLRDLLAVIDGWPAAVHVALQAFVKSNDRREAYVLIRDASDRFWLEQVYGLFNDEERRFFTAAAALPEIDVKVLERAGFSNALQLTDRLRLGTGLLHDQGDGIYRCPELFLEFLRRRTAFGDAREREAIHLRAAQALEAGGNIEAALTSYVTAHSETNVLRLLESNGFDLLERGRSEVTSQAIDALRDGTRRTSPRILALRGVLQSLAGNPVRAEVLLRRSLTLAKGDRDLAGFASLRLAPLIANYGGDITGILEPLADDCRQTATMRLEAVSLLAITRAIAGDRAGAKRAVDLAEELLVEIDLDSTRARVLQRVGVAAMNAGDRDQAKQSLVQAADLATELGLHSIACRSWSALSNLMCHAFDDVMSQLWYAEQAAGAARKSGDTLELQTALLQVAAAEMRRGNAEESAAIEEQLTSIRSDPQRANLLVAFKALRLAWEGHFSEAHRELTPCWNRMYHDFDRLTCGAQCALFLALDGRRKASISLLSEVGTMAQDISPHGLYGNRSIALAWLLCVVAELANDRATNVNRMVRKIRAHETDAVISLAARTAEEFAAPKGAMSRRSEIAAALDRLSVLGYADVARVLHAACSALDSNSLNAKSADLTRSELAVLRLLGQGLTTKEIAARDGRSVFTIRAHVANAIAKLGCHGRAQALALARRLQIIS